MLAEGAVLIKTHCGYDGLRTHVEEFGPQCLLWTCGACANCKGRLGAPLLNLRVSRFTHAPRPTSFIGATCPAPASYTSRGRSGCAGLELESWCRVEWVEVFGSRTMPASGVCGLNACDVGMIITDRRSTSCTHAQRLLIGGNR